MNQDLETINVGDDDHDVIVPIPKNISRATSKCPECGSRKLQFVMIEGDDHKFHEEVTCQGCGYTETN